MKLSCLTAALVAVLAPGCKKSADMAQVNDLARKAASDLGVTATKVTCPDHVDAEIGTKFVCSVGVGSASYDLDATIEERPNVDLYCNMKWHRGVAVNGAKLAELLEPEIGGQLNTPVKVACAEPIVFIGADHTIACDLTAGAQKVKAITTFDAKNESTDWRLDPYVASRVNAEKRLTQSVHDKIDSDVTVGCGSDALLLRPASGTIQCNLDHGDEHVALDVTLDEKAAITGWTVVPRAAAK